LFCCSLGYIYIIKAAIELRLLVLVLLLYFVDTIGAAIEGTRDNNRTSITLIAAIGLRIRFLKVERTRNDMPGIITKLQSNEDFAFLVFCCCLGFCCDVIIIRCVFAKQTTVCFARTNRIFRGSCSL
jgi:hypothetical protein